MREVKVVKCWMWELGRDREQLAERGSGCKEHEARIRILKNDSLLKTHNTVPRGCSALEEQR